MILNHTYNEEVSYVNQIDCLYLQWVGKGMINFQVVFDLNGVSAVALSR